MNATGRIDIIGTALEPLHHGKGTSGNTQLLRTQAIVTPQGKHAHVPFISGNSVKHMIRAAGAAHALDTMGVPDGSLDKRVVDLLFSGGHLSKTGAAVDLRRAREIGRLFPALSLCGYSAGNVMVQSKLSVGHLHLVCEENAWRVPAQAQAAAKPMLAMRAGQFREEEFGTRHEASRDPRVARMLTTGDTEAAEQRAIAGLGKKGVAEKADDSSQMIYEFQTIAPGARFWGRIEFRDCTQAELTALRAALAYACRGAEDGGYLFTVGAKASVGFGLMRWDVTGALRIDTPQWEPTDGAGIVPADVDPDLAAYAAHLRGHREEILTVLTEAFA